MSMYLFLPSSHHLKPWGPHNVVLVAHIIMVSAIPTDWWWWTGHSALKHMNLPSEFEPFGFGMVSDFWRLGLYRHALTFSMLPKPAHLPLITIQKCKPPRILLLKRNHSNYPSRCCTHEILAGIEASNLTCSTGRRFDCQKSILIKP